MSETITVYFRHSLKWVGDRTPGRRGGGIGMDGDPVATHLPCSPEAFDSDPFLAARLLWDAETRFLQWAQRNYPEHHVERWSAHRDTADGPELSHFICGFTFSE